MTKYVYYRFGDNWKRSKYLSAWKERNLEVARRCNYVYAVGWARSYSARQFGLVFLHDGDAKALREYEWYKQFGIPALNMKELLENESVGQETGADVVPVVADESNTVETVAPKMPKMRGARAKGFKRKGE